MLICHVIFNMIFTFLKKYLCSEDLMAGIVLLLFLFLDRTSFILDVVLPVSIKVGIFYLDVFI